MPNRDEVIFAYSKNSTLYDDEANQSSCWAKLLYDTLASATCPPLTGTVASIGCGSGAELPILAKLAESAAAVVGVEPAADLRTIAQKKYQGGRIRCIDGRFENLPFGDNQIQYMFSFMAFHWCSSILDSISEIDRVLSSGAVADIYFSGVQTGRSFIKKTTPIIYKALGLKGLLKARNLRLKEEARVVAEAFRVAMPARTVSCQETMHVYHDSLDGHLGWWVRISAQLEGIPRQHRQRIIDEIKKELASLEDDRGIPYTIHRVHIRIE